MEVRAAAAAVRRRRAAHRRSEAPRGLLYHRYGRRRRPDPGGDDRAAHRAKPGRNWVPNGTVGRRQSLAGRCDANIVVREINSQSRPCILCSAHFLTLTDDPQMSDDVVVIGIGISYGHRRPRVPGVRVVSDAGDLGGIRDAWAGDTPTTPGQGRSPGSGPSPRHPGDMLDAAIRVHRPSTPSRAVRLPPPLSASRTRWRRPAMESGCHPRWRPQYRTSSAPWSQKSVAGRLAGTKGLSALARAHRGDRPSSGR